MVVYCVRIASWKLVFLLTLVWGCSSSGVSPIELVNVSPKEIFEGDAPLMTIFGRYFFATVIRNLDGKDEFDRNREFKAWILEKGAPESDARPLQDVVHVDDAHLKAQIPPD